jgi:hypothetical protein
LRIISFVVSLSAATSPRVDGDRARQVALCHRGSDFGDCPDLRRQVGGELVHVLGEALPGARRAGHLGLAAQFALDADFTRDRRHLLRESCERIDHAVDRVGKRGDLALRVDGELLLQIAVRDRRDDLRDAAHLAR